MSSHLPAEQAQRSVGAPSRRDSKEGTTPTTSVQRTAAQRGMDYETAAAALVPPPEGAPVQLDSGSPELAVPEPQGGGSPLPDGVRGGMEQSFGADFSGVRVHEGPSAESMGGVRAATRGSDITFAQGEYAPDSRSGRELIGHELTHVVHQAAGRVAPTEQAKGGNINSDVGLEAEADQMGARAAAGLPARVAGAGALRGAPIGGEVTQFNIFTDIRDGVKGKYKKIKDKRAQDKQDRQDARNTNRTAIDDARDDATGAPEVTAEAAAKLLESLTTYVEGKLSGNRELVDKLKTHGRDHAKSRIGTGTQGKDDAAEYAKEILKASKAHHLAIDAKAGELARPKATAAEPEILAAAEEGYDNTSGSGDQAELIAKAKEKAASKAAKVVSDKATSAKKTLSQEIEADKANIEADLKNRTADGVEAKADEELLKRTNEDATVIAAVDQAYPDGKKTIEDALEAFLEDKLGVHGVAITRSKKLKEFREQMTKAGRDKAKTDAETHTAGQSDELQEDAKKRSADGADASTKKALKQLAADGTTDAMTTADVVSKLKAAASKAAWGSIRDGGRGKQAARQAVAAAVPAIQAEAIEQARTWKNEYLNDVAKQLEAAGKVETQVGTDQVGEKAGDESIAKKPDVDLLVGVAVPPAEELVKSQISKHLKTAIGAMGAGWWRSDAVRNFRAEMKKAGRQQAYGDLDTQIGSEGLRPATEAYMKVAGKEIAYDKAKGSVNEKMKAFAKEGAGEALTRAATKAGLEKVGRTAAFKAFRHGKPKPAAKADTIAAVNGAVATEVTKAMAEAETWKSELFSKTAIPDSEDQVKTQVQTDQVGQKSLKQAIKANTTAEGMAAVGRLVDLAVPQRGDACKVEIELRIPVNTGPGFVKLHLLGEAERGVTTRKNGAPPGGVDAKSLKVGMQFNIGGGIDAWGVRLDGTIGFFVRAQAMDTQKTFQALNYGAYRFACGINNGMADWWGGSGKAKDTSGGGHGKGATERAELWAAMVEENVFMRKNPHYDPHWQPGDPAKKKHEYIPDDDAFVDIGGALNAKGKVKAHVFEAEAQARGELFSHIDGATIKQRVKKAKQKGKIANTSDIGLGKGGTTEQDAKDRRKVIRPKTGGGMVLEAKTQFKILEQLIEFAGKLEIGTNGWGVEIAAGLKLDTASDAGPTLFEKIASGIVGSGASSLRSLVGLYQNAGQTGGEHANKGIGSLLDAGNDAENIIDSATGGMLTTALGKAYQTSAAKSDQVNETVSDKFDEITGQNNDMPENQGDKAGASSEVMLQIVIQIGPGTCALTIKQIKVRKLGVDLGGVALEAQIEKQKRLATLGMVGGRFHAEGLGFGTSRPRT